MSFQTSLCWLLVLILAAVMLFGFLSCTSRTEPRLGISKGRLKPCPNRPNCICSEYETGKSFIEPLTFTNDANRAWDNAKAAVQDIGGSIRKETDSYLRAAFTSRIFRFVDDVELRMDTADHVIHMRSASRTGYSDFGVNKNRLQQLRIRFMEKQKALTDQRQ